MSVTKEEKEGYVEVRIEGPLSVYEVSELRNVFIECFESYDRTILDLSSVTECDTAGVQLLYSAYITAKEKKKNFGVSSISEVVTDAMSCAGLNPDKVLKLQEEI